MTHTLSAARTDFLPLLCSHVLVKILAHSAYAHTEYIVDIDDQIQLHDYIFSRKL